jgi:hypothetical protein
VRSRVFVSILCLALFATGVTTAARANKGRDMMVELGFGGLKGKKLTKAIASAEAFPLGSGKNPVRANMPKGERAYLSRLRCSDGAAPLFDRSGSVGLSPYGFTMDLYQVICSGAKPVEVYMDMYHEGGETRPLPGFAIVDK